jgi:hypothetical protein
MVDKPNKGPTSSKTPPKLEKCANCGREAHKPGESPYSNCNEDEIIYPKSDLEQEGFWSAK